MKVFRRIFGNIDSDKKKLLIENALKVKKNKGYFNHDLDENSEEYESIKNLVQPLNLTDDIIGIEFTKLEISQAEVLVFRGVWVAGYPQPENPLEVLRNIYANSCPECGIHGEQKAHFQMKEPNLGKHKLMQLNWINDEIFAERNLYEIFFKDLGIEMQEASLYKKNSSVKSVVQLIIPKAQFNLEMKGIEFSTCAICKRVKYTPAINSLCLRPPDSNFHIVKTKEFFGTGHSAYNKILVSNETMNKMIDNKLAKYYNFDPAK